MCGFELGVILDIYDTPVYCVYLWLVLVWQVSREPSSSYMITD